MAEGPQLVLSTSGPFSCLFGDLLKIVLVHTEFNYDLQPQASGLQKQNPILSSWNGMITEGKENRMNEMEILECKLFRKA